ncbi:RNA polymerase subunit sigma [Fusibacter ferrireducens]|uniref:RNA polymerase sigma factor SigI n=1 Tax=Fusibacter ferrireducens TaxID=2785058 RepID=A0ABR9ZT26_9FIRM|nr:RNA polymerase subunit sigma [Fusibacter ferrireducens]MBF4693593.1 RNA polymerase subunit sigma [Fusibacter ferrireducens]
MGYDKKKGTTEAIITELSDAKSDQGARNAMIQRYMPFIVKCVSDFTGRYVSIGDSDELSVGLMAFNEAIDRYDIQKGLFLPYAKLVITSRLKTQMAKQNTDASPMEIQDLDHLQSDDILNKFQQENVLEDEIAVWKDELLKFRITFKDLLEKTPKHKDSRERTIKIAKQVSAHKPIVSVMFDKYRLPIQRIHVELKASVKVLEKNRMFITSVIIIFVKELGAIKRWIMRDGHK